MSLYKSFAYNSLRRVIALVSVVVYLNIIQNIRTHWWPRKRITFIYWPFNHLTQLLAQEIFIKMRMNFTSWTWKADYDTMLIKLERYKWAESSKFFWQGCK
jgi:hypothetical protein